MIIGLLLAPIVEVHMPNEYDNEYEGGWEPAGE